MAILEIHNLTKYYKDVRALSDVSLKVKAGEFVTVIGRSGAGKSTLLRCVNRMIEPSSGRIEFDGTDMRSLRKPELRRARTRIGMIFQHFNLVPRQTVIENVLHGRLGYKSTLCGSLGIYTNDEKGHAVEVLARLGLAEQMHKRCDQLSGGQKQRVGIARALVQDPRLILCDEPIASLDPSSSKTIMDHLHRISRDMKITILMNLHQVDIAIKYSDRLIGIREGSIVFDGDPKKLKKKTVAEIYGSDADDILFEESPGMTASLGVRKAFRRRNAITLGSFLLLFVLTAGSSMVTQFDWPRSVGSFPKAFGWMASNFIPNERALKNAPKIGLKLAETVLVSVMASVVAGALAFLLAILGSRTTRPHRLVSGLVRLVASLCRNIPVVAWAMIFLLSFGQNILTGILSLFISTLGFLTRAFMETVDEAAESSVEALRASGAPWLATVTQAVVPSVMPQVASWLLFMVETNIRDATLVGILTGTGIGFLFDLYYKSLNYPTAAFIVICIIVVVVLIEVISNALRRVIL